MSTEMNIMNKEEWTTGPEALGITTPATLEILDWVIQMRRVTLGIPVPMIQTSHTSLGISEQETPGATGGINTGTTMNNGEKGMVIR